MTEASSAADRKVSCARLREHLAELRLDGTGADRVQHRRALVAAMGDSFVNTCQRTYRDDDVACALDAPDSQTARDCLAIAQYSSFVVVSVSSSA